MTSPNFKQDWSAYFHECNCRRDAYVEAGEFRHERGSQEGEECPECLAEATRISETKSRRELALSPVLMLIPDFSPLTITVAGPLIVLEFLYVLAAHIFPFYVTINDDRFSVHNTWAQSLWLKQFRFVGLSTTALFIATWAFGYISPHRWKHISSSSKSFYYLHVGTAIARLTICVLLLLILFIPLVQLWPWKEMKYLWGWLWIMLVPSLVHLGTAIGRAGNSRNPVFWRSQYRAAGPGFDLATGVTVDLPSPQERKAQQAESRSLQNQKSSIASRDAVWYQPKLSIDTKDAGFIKDVGLLSWCSALFGRSTQRSFQSVIERTIEQASHRQINDARFSSCYCCLDAVPKVLNANKPAWYDIQYSGWRSRRSRFLGLPNQPQSELTVGESSVLLHDGTPLSQLCVKCETMCGRSDLLDLMSGMTVRRFAKYLRFTLNPSFTPEELFEHWATATQLFEEARSGCHLCSLMVDTLSPDQRDALIRQDTRLDDGPRDTEDANADDVQRHAANSQKSQGIYVKLLAPSSSPLQWRPDKNRNYSKSSVLLIPHFGFGTVPRRWQNRRRVERAQSLNMDPAMKWWLEHIEPIEIRKTESSFPGPICIGVHRSTADISSIDYIQRWLVKHEHKRESRALDEATRPALAPQRIGTTSAQHQQPNPRYPKLSSDKVLPSRLIDLSASNNPDLDVRVTTNFQVEDGDVKYAALSYCWRANETNILTAHSGLTDLSVSALAPTIRDAIAITRRLGLRYLWVDALCIQQDSEQDKEDELRKMSSIYANAEFVIAADAAEDSSESFIIDRNPLSVNPCLVGVRGLARSAGTHKPGTFEGIYALPSRKYASWAFDDLKYSRMSSRGWVFQEERLARRTVHFTNHQLILQCNICNTRLTELDWENVCAWSDKIYFDLVRPDLVFTLYRLLWSLLWDNIIPRSNAAVSFVPEVTRQTVEVEVDSSFALTLQSTSSDRMQTEVWWSLVEAYSQRFLSRNSDRLDAIEGLASRIQRALELMPQRALERIHASIIRPTYCLGVFDSSDSLTPSLLWYVSDARSVRPQIRAPSWSWASVDGAIKNNSVFCSSDPRKSKIEIIEGPSKRGGSILVRGRLRAATRRPLSNVSAKYYVGHHQTLDIRHPQYHDQFSPLVKDPTSGPEVYALLDVEGTEVGFFIPDTDEDLPRETSLSVGEIYCLQIIARPLHPSAEEDFAVPWATRGLALTQYGSTDNLYRRVGYIELARDHPEMSSSSAWPGKARNRRTRPYPQVDKHGFFANCPEKTIEII